MHLLSEARLLAGPAVSAAAAAAPAATTRHAAALSPDVDVGRVEDAGDYNEMAQLALMPGSPGEAQRILEKGFAEDVFADQRIEGPQPAPAGEGEEGGRDRPGARCRRSRRTRTQPRPATRTSALGLAYFGYGQYDKAAERPATRASPRAASRTRRDARLLLGIAQLKAGHKDDARSPSRRSRAIRRSSAWRTLVLHAKQPARGARLTRRAAWIS